MANKEKAKKSPDIFMTPGTLLRDAREKKGLKIKDVAERLHLKQEYITAIEEDDYSSFASLAYVRGYIGNYSKLLEAGDEILVAFDSLGLKQEKPVSIDTNALLFTSEKLRKRTHLVRWLSLLVFVVLIVLLAVLWQGKNKDNNIPKPLDNEVQQIVTPTAQPATSTEEITAAETTNTSNQAQTPATAPAVTNSTGTNAPVQATTPTSANTPAAPSVSGDATPITTAPGTSN